MLFQLSLRTIYRWESRGVNPSSLPLDPKATKDASWRRNLLIWMLERYKATGVSDTRKKRGESP